MKSLNNILNSKKGFVLLYAVLIMGLLLALTFSITNITIKERKLSRFSEESFSAFFAAESGMECALYWDLKDDESWFRYDPTEPGGRDITCNGQTFRVGKEESGVDEMTIVFPDFSNSSVVVVDKSVPGNTSLLSSGYNVVDSTVGSGVERGISVKYGDVVEDVSLDCDFDVLLVLDNSGSILPFGSLLKSAATSTIENGANSKFRMGLVSFDSGAKLLNEEGLIALKPGNPGKINRKKLNDAIESLTFPGGTNMEAGLFIAQQEFLSSRNRPNARDVIVLVTDGETNQCVEHTVDEYGEKRYKHTDPIITDGDDGVHDYNYSCDNTFETDNNVVNAADNAARVAAELHEQEVMVVVVGVNVTPAYATYLKDIISYDNYVEVASFADLKEKLGKIDCSYFSRAVSGMRREEF